MSLVKAFFTFQLFDIDGFRRHPIIDGYLTAIWKEGDEGGIYVRFQLPEQYALYPGVHEVIVLLSYSDSNIAKLTQGNEYFFGMPETIIGKGTLKNFIIER